MRCRILQLALAAAMGPVYGCANSSFIATLITLGLSSLTLLPPPTTAGSWGLKNPNKPLSWLCRIPFFIAAPTTTLDPHLPDGSRITIEQRPPEEVTHHHGKRVAPEGINASASYLKAVWTSS